MRQEDDPRVVFIHLNHTNPLCNPESVESTTLTRFGWETGREGMSFQL
jgi:phosphoribosyl 1,2-cyclic phosphodiesterase